MKIKICEKPVVDSTNEWAKRMAEEGAPEGTLAFSDMQTAGRGSRGRNWDSPAGDNIYMSLILHPTVRPASASRLTLVMGLSVAEAIMEEESLAVGIKWPNDVIIGRKKVCGILTEMKVDGDMIRYVVIGCGINVNMEQFPEDLKDKATSLRIEVGRPVERKALMNAVLIAFNRYYRTFLKTEDLSFMRQRYNAILANARHRVRVLTKDPYVGTALGITDTGELLIRTDDGAIAQIASGEVSVRGLYSYV